jgi:hypothetical protein
MGIPRCNFAAALFAAALVAAVAVAPGVAGWSSSAAAGSQLLLTVSLAAPTNVTAARGACTILNAASLTVNVSWTATTTSRAQGYSILRSTSAAGPFTAVGTTSGINTTTWTDATAQLAFSTTYYYIVKSTIASWTSAAAGPANVATPSSLCIG